MVVVTAEFTVTTLGLDSADIQKRLTSTSTTASKKTDPLYHMPAAIPGHLYQKSCERRI